jgi:hypothetical protein
MFYQLQTVVIAYKCPQDCQSQQYMKFIRGIAIYKIDQKRLHAAEVHENNCNLQNRAEALASRGSAYNLR